MKRIEKMGYSGGYFASSVTSQVYVWTNDVRKSGNTKDMEPLMNLKNMIGIAILTTALTGCISTPIQPAPSLNGFETSEQQAKLLKAHKLREMAQKSESNRVLDGLLANGYTNALLYKSSITNYSWNGHRFDKSACYGERTDTGYNHQAPGDFRDLADLGLRGYQIATVACKARGGNTNSRWMEHLIAQNDPYALAYQLAGDSWACTHCEPQSTVRKYIYPFLSKSPRDSEIFKITISSDHFDLYIKLVDSLVFYAETHKGKRLLDTLDQVLERDLCLGNGLVENIGTCTEKQQNALYDIRRHLDLRYLITAYPQVLARESIASYGDKMLEVANAMEKLQPHFPMRLNYAEIRANVTEFRALM
ncbi:hypothetical protein [Ferrimonas futtsuensis]|uniref:hypothetical protein n=1 Tax=Ferrimonas futtsuensis TaxID=364764 RepID=UPI0012FA660D|nr:hypothetical protein [Ferrimonas futtsuensis]